MNCARTLKARRCLQCKVENSDGCQAILGISGSKEGAEVGLLRTIGSASSGPHLWILQAWDAPINILKNAANKEVQRQLTLASL